MPLTKEIATSIVTAVDKDAECQRRTNSVLRILPDGWGAAGPIRNWALSWKWIGRQGWARAAGNQSMKNEDLNDPQYAEFVCSGIADAAVQAISGATIPEVKQVVRIDREVREFHHSAVQVTLADDSEYVFDWWWTLNVNNPMIYHKLHWATPEHSDAMRHTFRNFDPSLYDLK